MMFNMNKRKKIIHFLGTSRPYSYMSEISRGLIFGVLLSSEVENKTLWGVAILSFLMWVYFNWQSDWIQGDKGRLKPSYWLCYAPFILSIMCCLYFGAFYGVLGVCFYAITILLYSLKANNKVLSKLAILLRILSVFGHLVMIMSFIGYQPKQNYLNLLAVIVLLKGISNFVGDIRDVRTDKWEFPVQYGTVYSFYFLRILFFTTLLLGCFINEEVLSIYSLVVVFSQWIIFEFLVKKYSDKAYIVGYIEHRFLIFSTSVYQLLLLFHFNFSLSSILLLVILLIITQFSYVTTPGKNYKKVFDYE